MNNLKARIREFFRRHKKKIIIFALVAWLIVFIINQILKSQQNKLPAPSTTYTPHVSVYNSDDKVPEKYQKPIENLVDTYFNYCNNKEYDKAYDLITDECKKNVYPTLEQFTQYVDHVFEGKHKIYNIQNYSIVGNKYVYNIRILDDILSNGTTDGYYYYEEKLILIEENGNFKLSIGEFIEDKNPHIISENDDMIVEISDVYIDYDSETYTIKIKNKTDKYIVVSDNTQNTEIVLDLGEQSRKPENMMYAFFYIAPNSSETQKIKFSKYYDNGLTSKRLILNSIRVLSNYDWKTGTTEEDLNNAVKLYSLSIDLNQ